jgi:predicted amidohydrolase YtcJ
VNTMRGSVTRFTVRLSVLILLWPLISTATQAQVTRDTILTNGKILTLDAQSTIVEALSIRDGMILTTGTNADVRQAAHPDARVIDLVGRTVIPGLIDSHIHAIRAGFRFATEVSWIGATSIQEATDRLRHAVLYARPDQWIVVGGGWTPQQFAEGRRPTAAELLAAVPAHPLYVQLFYSAAFLSPAGQRVFGITDVSGLPPTAKFELADDGARTGWISGDATAITGLFAKLPEPTPDDSIVGTRRFLRELNRLGITGVIDPGGHNLAPADYRAIMQVWRAGQLTVRVAYSLCAPRAGHELADLELITQTLSMGTGDDMLRFNGIGERLTWGMYNNDTPTEQQIDAMYQLARWAAARGLTLTAHWNNDQSVHHLLDVFDRVNRETPIVTLRWSIAHLHDASERSLVRMNMLGVGWLMQNGLHFATTNYIAARGAAINRAPPIKTALRLGVRVGGGTDADRVMSHNPFVSLQWMVDGRTVDGMTTRSPSELLTREEALRLYTVGSAWFTFDDHTRGTLEPGRLADLAVLDLDYLTIPETELGRLQSLLTMVGGRVVYAAGAFADEEQARP